MSDKVYDPSDKTGHTNQTTDIVNRFTHKSSETKKDEKKNLGLYNEQNKQKGPRNNLMKILGEKPKNAYENFMAELIKCKSKDDRGKK